MKLHDIGLFIFRRDLRLKDNTGLIKALKECKTVIPCFIFDPAQVGESNTYRSMNAVQFMVESLEDLQEQLHACDAKLYLFYGASDAVLRALLNAVKINAVYCNSDYTPFSIQRDAVLQKLCTQKKIAFYHVADLLLNEPGTVLTQSNQPYKIFTAFYNRAVHNAVAPVQTALHKNFYTMHIDGEQSPAVYKKICPSRNTHLHVHGGSKNARSLLSKLSALEDYARTRDIPALATSNLSAHLKFGTISVRQVYAAIIDQLGSAHPLVRQLYWRDFFTHIVYFFPQVLGHAFNAKYDALTWDTNARYFNAWKNGTTGFPIVDAGMRQLNETGFMHNRVRMIVASFLTKDLHIDWRKGERYFATQLVDYDPAVNNGNWQWAASTGCDAQPYFRIFNPWLQQKKFDPQCVYIKRWIPELQSVSSSVIHTWYKEPKQPLSNPYPRPIVDHGVQSALAKKMYKKVVY